MGIGLPEIIVIFFVIHSIFVPIWITIRLSKKYPSKKWLGIVLSLLFGPIGQLYIIKGSAKWIIIVLLCVAFILVPTKNYAISYFIGNIISAITMYYRMPKNERTSIIREEKKIN